MLLSKVNTVFIVILNLAVAIKIQFVQFFNGMHLKLFNRASAKKFIRRTATTTHKWIYASARYASTGTAAAATATSEKRSDAVLPPTSLPQINGTNPDLIPFEQVPVIKRLPIVGKIYNFLTKSQTRLLDDIDKNHKRFGPIYRDQIGSLNVVFVSSADMMRSVFLYEGKYPRHALPESWTLYNQLHGCERGLFFMEGEDWLKHRKILNSFMLRGPIPTTLEPSIQAADMVVNRLMQLASADTKLIPTEIPNLDDILYKWAFDELIRVILGPRTSAKPNFCILEPLLTKFTQTVQKLFEYSSQLLGFSPHMARTLKLKRWTQFEQNVTDTLDLAKQLIHVSIHEFNGGDGLLAEMQTSNIGEEMIQKILVDLVIAAGDTSANAVKWTLHLLATHQTTQQCIREEIHQNMAHQYDTGLLRGTIKESLRLYPVAPLIGRFISSDAILGNYRVPKESLVVLSVFTAGRSAQHFYDPLKFIPSRWTTTTTTTATGEDAMTSHQQCTFKPHASLPFALGARSCIGRKIALNSMQVLVSKILQNFQLYSNNIGEITPIMKMVTVPHKKIRIAVKPLLQ